MKKRMNTILSVILSLVILIAAFACGDTTNSSSPEAQTVTISFVTYTEEDLSDITRKVGGAYGELPTPTREDYSFLGWYTANFEKQVHSTTLVRETQDHSLYALWQAVEKPEPDPEPILPEYEPDPKPASPIEAKPSRIAAGENHSVVIDNDGKLFAWGENDYGQIGNGKSGVSKTAYTPTEVLTENCFMSVSAGIRHTLAIDEDGQLWGWGYFDSAEKEVNGTVRGTSTPKQTLVEKKIKQAVAGSDRSHVIDEEGNLWAWGKGPLGDGTTDNHDTAIQIMEGTKFSYVEAGSTSTYAIDEEGNLWAWGNNRSGVLGNGTTENQYTPVQITEGKKIIKIDASGSHALMLDDEGKLFAWGTNASGQLGDGTMENHYMPVQIMQGKYFTDIGVDMLRSYAIDVRGQLWGWGKNNGYLGNGKQEAQLYPVLLRQSTKYSQIAVGYQHALALDTDGQYWTWGRNIYGQIGDGATKSYLTPTHVFQDKHFVKVSARFHKTLAIDTEGNLWAWGRHLYGEYIYQNVQVMPDKKFKEISAGDRHSLVIDTEGNLWAWGRNSSGQLGNGTTQDSYTPVQVMKGTKFVQASAGGDFSHAIDEKGNLWGWGRKLCVGNNSGTSETQPVQIKKGTKFKQVAASGGMVFALDMEGNLWGWGGNGDGGLGDGTFVSKSSPVMIAEGSRFLFIATNIETYDGDSLYRDAGALAIDTEGHLWGWGIHMGTSAGAHMGILPKLYLENQKFTMTALGGSSGQRIVLDTDGKLWAWGRSNAYGQLGNGTTTVLYDPEDRVEIMPEKSFVYVAANNSTSYAIDTEGKLWAWGKNDYGQLNGATSIQYTPKRITLEEE